MARSYTLRGLTAANGLALVNVWCRAYNATTDALVETAYTDSSGEASFTALPDDANVNICCIPGVKGDQVTWLYNIFSAAQDLSYGEIITQSAQIKDAIITSAKIGTLDASKITSGYISVDRLEAGSITAAKLSLTGEWYNASGVEIDSTHGINIYGTANALTTRATKTGTIQCYIGADGKIYAGAGAIMLDSSGLTIYGQVLKFYSGATYVGVAGAYSTTAMWMGAVAGSLSLLSAGSIYAGRSILASSTTYDIGDATYYFDDINYKDLIDRGCARPVFPSYSDVIRGIKTKRRHVTLQEAKDEGMGKAAIERIKKYGEEIEELDLDTFPEDMLRIPTQEDYDKAERRYQELVEYTGEGKETLLPIKRLTPKVGRSLEDLIYVILRSHQETIERLDRLEGV